MPKHEHISINKRSILTITILKVGQPNGLRDQRHARGGETPLNRFFTIAVYDRAKQRCARLTRGFRPPRTQSRRLSQVSRDRRPQLLRVSGMQAFLLASRPGCSHSLASGLPQPGALHSHSARGLGIGARSAPRRDPGARLLRFERRKHADLARDQKADRLDRQSDPGDVGDDRDALATGSMLNAEVEIVPARARKP